MRARDLNLLEGHLKRATDTKNAILRANLRLVVSVARKHLRPGLTLMELISEGNLTLMRAVDGFDAHKGNRFSTYATLALMKGFARSVPQMLAGRRATGAGDDQFLSNVPDRTSGTDMDRIADREEVGRLLAFLTDKERSVVRARFGLGGTDGESLEGGRLGLTRQQIRQIEQAALLKMRAAQETSAN